MQTSPASNAEFQPAEPDGAAMLLADGRYDADAGGGQDQWVAVDHDQPQPPGFDWG